MIHLRSISIKSTFNHQKHFPFNLPIFKNFNQFPFLSPITFLVGENGSGKSTLLEAIAAGVNSIIVGGESIRNDDTLESARILAKNLKFTWNQKTHRGFFLRAEDFFRFTRRMYQLNKEMENNANDFEKMFTGYGQLLAKGSALAQKAAITQRYGEDLNENSHGESFLKLFQARFVPKGLYLLDEPETPLSPLRQLSFLSLLKDMVNQNAQFIIATHSPILMAFPNAQIYSFDDGKIQQIAYDDVEHVTLTRDFLNNPQQFLRHL